MSRRSAARQTASRVLWPLLAALLSFVAWQPFVRPDFNLWQADDGEYHLLRVYVFEAAFRAGEWLPRWTPDLFVGYGYPIFNFYAPGTYYLALLVRLLGFDIFSTVQAEGALATCLGAAGAFCLARAVFGRSLPGLVAALAYAYAPYPFITNLVIRADLAETLGLALLPWALLAAWCAGRTPSRWAAALLAGGVGAVVLTHNLTALVALPAAAATGLFAASRSGASHRWAGARAVFGGLALALTLTAFFWVPALVEQRDVQIHVALQGADKQPTVWLVNPLGSTEQTRRAGNPQTAGGPLDLHLAYPYDLNFPPKPSLVQGALFGVSLLLTIAGILRRAKGAAETGFFLAGTLVIWLATTTWSTWAWQHVPLMRFLQFAWRLYGPLALSLGLFAAGATAIALQFLPRDAPHILAEPRLSQRERPRAARVRAALVAALPVALAVLLAANTTTARPLWIDPHVERRVGGPQLVATENATFGAGTTTGGEFVPRTVDLEALGPGKRYGNGVYERFYPEFGWLAGRTWTLAGEMRVEALAGGPTWTEARVEAATPGTLAFHTVLFPGWHAYVDGSEVTAKIAPKEQSLGVSLGFLAVDVPAGSHRVQIAFGPTPLRSATAALSVLALAWLSWWVAGRRRLLLSSSPAPVIPNAAQHPSLSPLPIVGEPGCPRAAGWPARGRRVRGTAVGEGQLGSSRTGESRQVNGAAVPRRRGVRGSSRRLLALVPAALFAIACAHDAIRPALGAPVNPRGRDTRLVADLAALAGAGGAQISSPSGPALGPFVHVQRLSVDGRERRWLYMHPPSSLSASLTLPPRAAFQAGLALDPQTWDAEGADGVFFVVEVTPDGGSPVPVLRERVNPRARAEQRTWLDRWVDLSAFGGRHVTLTLRTEPADTVAFDWAGWADPVIFVQQDARRPGGGPPSPLPTPRAS